MLSLLNSCLSKVAPGRPHSASRYIMEDVFVFLPPRPLSCCVFLAKMVSSRPAPCWHFFCPSCFCRWNASSHVVSLPRTQSRFSGPFLCMCVQLCVCACVCSAHCAQYVRVAPAWAYWGKIDEIRPWWIFSNECVSLNWVTGIKYECSETPLAILYRLSNET